MIISVIIALMKTFQKRSKKKDSDHQTLTTNLKISFRRNKKRSIAALTGPNFPEIKRLKNHFAITLTNRYESLNTETDDASANTNYDHFIKENRFAAQHCLPLKVKVKNKFSWENNKIMQTKRELKEAAHIKNQNKTRANINNA